MSEKSMSKALWHPCEEASRARLDQCIRKAATAQKQAAHALKERARPSSSHASVLGGEQPHPVMDGVKAKGAEISKRSF